MKHKADRENDKLLTAVRKGNSWVNRMKKEVKQNAVWASTGRRFHAEREPVQIG